MENKKQEELKTLYDLIESINNGGRLVDFFKRTDQAQIDRIVKVVRARINHLENERRGPK